MELRKTTKTWILFKFFFKILALFSSKKDLLLCLWEENTIKVKVKQLSPSSKLQYELLILLYLSMKKV